MNVCAGRNKVIIKATALHLIYIVFLLSFSIYVICMCVAMHWQLIFMH